jgi:tetratricopeptide (TPR) repeat protein
MVLFFDRRGRAREGLELFERTITAMEANFSTTNAERTTLLAEYLVNVAWLHYCLGQHRPAHVRAERAAVLARGLGESGLMTLSKALNTLGNITKTSNELEAAIRYSTEALECAQAMQDPSREMICLVNLALAEDWIGQTLIAKTHYAKAMRLAEQIGDMNSICNIKLSLGLLLLHNPNVGDQTECRDLLESGLELTVREQILSLEPHFHINLCELSLLMDNLKLARQHAERAFNLARSIVEPSTEAGAILCLGRVSHAEGDFETALHLYQTALQQAQTLQDSALIFDGLLAIASLRIKTGDMRSAEFALEKICQEAAPESWYRREAIRLLKNSNLEIKTSFIVDG